MNFEDQLLDTELNEEKTEVSQSEDDKNLFEQMVFGSDILTIKPGSIIEGTITIKDRDYGYLSVQSKNEARIIAREIEDFEVGDTIEVKVLREDDDYLIVSKFLLDKEKEFETYSEGDIVSGVIKKRVKGGYQVSVGKNDGFLPLSLSLINPKQKFENKTYEFIIKEKGSRSLTVSRLDLIQKAQDEFFEKNNEGDVVTTIVKGILDFGVILESDNVSGLLHISEVDWNQVDDLNSIFKIGDTVTAKIIEKDVKNNKIKYSIKELKEDPFITFTETHKIGDIVDIEVAEVLDFGLKVKMGEIIGFIHVTELSWSDPYSELSKYQVGDKLEAKIVTIEEDKRNIKLSIKQLTENPWNSVKEKYPVGTILMSPVKEVFDFGAVFELEPNITGMLHISDISYKKVSSVKDLYNIGDVVTSKVIGYNDEKERVNLSVKSLIDDAWENLPNKYQIEDVVKGRVTDISNYGLFVEIEKGISAFIHSKEFAWLRDEIKEYNIGDEVEFKIIILDVPARNLVGSIKQLIQSPWKEAEEKYSIGNKVKVEIVDIQNNYVLVKLTDRFNGIIPISELSTNRIENINDYFSIGDEVEAVVIDTNESKKSIVLSIRRVKETEEKEEMNELLKQYSVDGE